MTFSGLENIRKEKRDNQKVVSLLIGSLNRRKIDFYFSSVSDVLMDIYNVAGQKVKKRVYDGTVTPNTLKDVHYLDGFQYAGDVLQFFPHAEGYVDVTANEGIGGLNYLYNYVFNYTDHLGNIRMSFTKDPVNGQLKIMEENHYYPFGLKHNVYSTGIKQKYELVENMENTARPAYVYQTDYQYKYNGKELQDELNLNTYAYGWRDYDPATARFNKIDRFAEKYYNLSPYGYAGNNPTLFIDIQGDSIGLGREHYDKFVNDVENQISNINNNRASRRTNIASARESGNDRKADRLERQDARATENENGDLAVLNETLGELRALESSNVVYDVITNASNLGNPSTEGYLGYDESGGSVTVNLTSGYNRGVLAHEFKHAFQYETGMISIFISNGKPNGGQLYDIQDEVEAYKRGSFFGGTYKSQSEIMQKYSEISDRTTQRTLRNTSVSRTGTVNGSIVTQYYNR